MKKYNKDIEYKNKKNQFFRKIFKYYYEIEKRNILPIPKELKWLNKYILKGIKNDPYNINFIKYPTDDMFLSCQNNFLWCLLDYKLNIPYYSKFIELVILLNLKVNDLHPIWNFNYIHLFQNPSFEVCQYIIYNTNSIYQINRYCCYYNKALELYKFLKI
jgi:hypothetical protein